jgi:hypothetical protein
MLPLLLLAVTADAPTAAAPRATASQQVQAVVRIVRGVEIRFHTADRFEESVAREAVVRERDGSLRAASLIEFY